MKRAITGLAIALLGLLSSHSSAQAEEPTVSVLALQSTLQEESLADVVSNVLRQILADTQGLRAIDRTDLTLPDLFLIYECEVPDARCFGDIAAALETDQVLTGKVEALGDADVLVTLSIYIAPGGDRLGAASPSLAGKPRSIYSRRIPTNKLRSTLEADLADLVEGSLWELPAYLSLTASVPGAEAFVDGRTIGAAPIDRERIRPGAHSIRIVAPDRRPWEQLVTFYRGQRTDLHAELTKDEVLAVSTETVDVGGPEGPTIDALDDDFGTWVAAWVLGSVGVAALGSAVATGVLAARTEDQYRTENRQRQARDLREQGEDLAIATNVLIGVGAAAAITSVCLFAFAIDYGTQSSEQETLGLTGASLLPTRDGRGAFVGASFQF